MAVADIKAERDRCVNCGKETEYDRNVPISQRYGYIEGAGQLCRECYRSVYQKGEGGHD